MKNDTMWADLLNMRFGVKLDDGEAKEWFLELRRTVRGFEWDQIIEPDPFKSDQARLINHEICDALRFIAGLDKPPRADKDHGVYKYTVSDIQLWIIKYRDHHKLNTKADKSRRVSVAKKICHAFHKKGDLFNAAFSAYNPMHSKQGEVFCLQEGIGNVSLEDYEIKQVEHYCKQSLGFDPQSERIEWSKANGKRIMTEYKKKPIGAIAR